jgi:hypothetical protein
MNSRWRCYGRNVPLTSREVFAKCPHDVPIIVGTGTVKYIILATFSPFNVNSGKTDTLN